MNIVQRIGLRLAGLPEAPAQAPAAAKAYGAGATWSQLWMAGNAVSLAGGTLPNSPAGWRAAARMVWAGNAINARAKAISQTPFRLYRRSTTTSQPDAEDAADEVVDHPVLALLRAPGPLLSDTTTLLELLERNLSIYGDCMLFKVRGDSRRQPAELHALPIEQMVMVRDGKRYVTEYVDLSSGARYQASDVLRFHYPDDDDPMVARSPTSSAVDSINRYVMADIAQQGIDRRGGQGGGVISTNFNALSIDEERFKLEWDSMRSDPRNAGRDAFLPPGTAYSAGVLTAQQQQREERMTRLKKETFAAYSTPPALAGDYSDASILANADQQTKNFWQLWAVPECEMIARRLTAQLLWAEWPEAKEQGLYIAPEFDDIYALQADQRAVSDIQTVKANTANVWRAAKIASLNEARAHVGLDPIDDPRADEVLLDESIANQTAINQAPPQKGADKAVTDEDSPAKARTLMPIVDFVGMTATDERGERIGVIEKIHRFGLYDGIEATKAEPVVIVGGIARLASQVRVALGGVDGEA